MVLDEVKSSFARTEAASARFRRLEAEVIPRVRRNLEASEAAYVAGQIDFLTLVDTQRMLLTSLLAREAALAELASRRAELVKAVGGSLAAE
jgi:outer membrane protein TolC